MAQPYVDLDSGDILQLDDMAAADLTKKGKRIKPYQSVTPEDYTSAAKSAGDLSGLLGKGASKDAGYQKAFDGLTPTSDTGKRFLNAAIAAGPSLAVGSMGGPLGLLAGAASGVAAFNQDPTLGNMAGNVVGAGLGAGLAKPLAALNSSDVNTPTKLLLNAIAGGGTSITADKIRALLSGKDEQPSGLSYAVDGAVGAGLGMLPVGLQSLIKSAQNNPNEKIRKALLSVGLTNPSEAASLRPEEIVAPQANAVAVSRDAAEAADLAKGVTLTQTKAQIAANQAKKAGLKVDLTQTANDYLSQSADFKKALAAKAQADKFALEQNRKDLSAQQMVQEQKASGADAALRHILLDKKGPGIPPAIEDKLQAQQSLSDIRDQQRTSGMNTPEPPPNPTALPPIAESATLDDVVKDAPQDIQLAWSAYNTPNLKPDKRVAAGNAVKQWFEGEVARRADASKAPPPTPEAPAPNPTGDIKLQMAKIDETNAQHKAAIAGLAIPQTPTAQFPADMQPQDVTAYKGLFDGKTPPTSSEIVNRLYIGTPEAVRGFAKIHGNQPTGDVLAMEYLRRSYDPSTGALSNAPKEWNNNQLGTKLQEAFGDSDAGKARYDRFTQLNTAMTDLGQKVKGSSWSDKIAGTAVAHAGGIPGYLAYHAGSHYGGVAGGIGAVAASTVIVPKVMNWITQGGAKYLMDSPRLLDALTKWTQGPATAQTLTAIPGMALIVRQVLGEDQ